MDNKIYSAVGITTRNNITKVRFGNDMVARIKIFAKQGDTVVDFSELPKAMTKYDGLVWLQTQPVYSNPVAKEAIDTKLNEIAKLAKAGEVKVQAKAPKAVAQTTDKVTA